MAFSIAPRLLARSIRPAQALLQPARPAASTLGLAGVRGRAFHASSAARADAPGANPKKKAALSAELFPLYAIVGLAVSAALYSLGNHLLGDNDLRRLPETPDEHGKPLPRPDWQEKPKPRQQA